MSEAKVEAIVLRRANYGESNRMLTLLTPGGLVSASARGCRKTTSRMLAATELFASGEYMLAQKGERSTVTSCSLRESYYPIREDVDRLSHGVYWLNLCEAAAQPGEASGRLMKMLLLSLAVLAYGDGVHVRALTAVFLSQFAMVQGFAPRLDACIRCGRLPGGTLRFDAEQGGVGCGACLPDGDALRPETFAWMQAIQSRGAFVLAGRQPMIAFADEEVPEEAFVLYRRHVELRLEKRIASGSML